VGITAQQIDEAFTNLFGLPPPDPAVLNVFVSIGDYDTVIADIITLPQVQTQVLPVLQMFDLATGHNPTAATLSSIDSSGLTQPQLADVLVASPTFSNLYNGGTPVDPNAPVTTSLVDSMFLVGLGHMPTTATEHGFAGLTNEQAFIAIATSAAMTETQTVGINSYLTSELDLWTNAPTHY
jgi:hypothetical protein